MTPQALDSKGPPIPAGFEGSRRSPKPELGGNVAWTIGPMRFTNVPEVLGKVVAGGPVKAICTRGRGARARRCLQVTEQ